MLTLFNRFRGMKSEDRPIKLSQTVWKLLCGLPFGIFAGLVSTSALPIALITAVLVWIATFGAFTDGHGNQFDLGKSDEANEKPNLWDKIFGKEGYTAEMLGMTASGLIVVIPLAIALVYSGYYIAAACFLVWPGLFKGVAYDVAQKANFKFPALKAHGNDDIGRNPDGGEVLWGITLDLGLIMAAGLVILQNLVF